MDGSNNSQDPGKSSLPLREGIMQNKQPEREDSGIHHVPSPAFLLYYPRERRKNETISPWGMNRKINLLAPTISLVPRNKH
jgi:hypothetical protein